MSTPAAPCSRPRPPPRRRQTSAPSDLGDAVDAGREELGVAPAEGQPQAGVRARRALRLLAEAPEAPHDHRVAAQAPQRLAAAGGGRRGQVVGDRAGRRARTPARAARPAPPTPRGRCARPPPARTTACARRWVDPCVPPGVVRPARRWSRRRGDVARRGRLGPRAAGVQQPVVVAAARQRERPVRARRDPVLLGQLGQVLALADRARRHADLVRLRDAGAVAPLPGGEQQQAPLQVVGA